MLVKINLHLLYVHGSEKIDQHKKKKRELFDFWIWLGGSKVKFVFWKLISWMWVAENIIYLPKQ